MSTAIQRRGGSTTQIDGFAGAPREVVIDTDKWTAVVMDGATPGGHPLAKEDELKALEDAVGKTLRVDTPQTFTPSEKGQLLANAGGSILAGLRNKLINGSFLYWQRGTSFNITTVSNTYTADRMVVTLNQRTSGTLVVARNTAQKQVGTTACLEVNANSLVTTAAIDVTQIIETAAVQELAGKLHTQTVWLKVLSGTALITMRTRDGTNQDAYPSTSATETAETKTVTTTWQKFTITHTVQNGALSLATRISTPTGFNGVLYVSKWSLDEGDTTAEADPFSLRHPGLELTLCQRYFEIVSGVVLTSANFNYRDYYFKVSKRAPVALYNLVLAAGGTGVTFTASFQGYDRIYQDTPNSVVSNFTVWADAEL